MAHLRPSTLVDGIGEAASIKQNNLVYELQTDGADIVTLSLGEAFFDIPAPFFEELTPAAHHYSHTRGVPLLRRKLAAYHESTSGTPVDPDREIMVTAGSKSGIFMTLAAILEPGGEVIISEPLWVSYPDQVRLCRGVPVALPWHATVDDIAAQITDRTRAIIINNPHNPTGRRLSEDELRTLHALAEAHNLVLIADEVYSEFVPEGERFVSAAVFDPDKRHTVICNSMSKNFGVSGWRIGYVIAHENLIRQLDKLQQHLVTCAPTILCQYLAEHFEDVLAHTRPQIREVVCRRNRVADAFAARGVTLLPGDSTFYLFPSLGSSRLGSTEFTRELLTRHGVSTVAGIAYGASCDRFIRVSVGAESEERVRRGVTAICDLIDDTATGAVASDRVCVTAGARGLG